MKLRTVVKIAITSSVVLLCTGFIVFYFLKLSSADNKETFNLYKLVPCSATAVIETDNMVGLIQDVNEASSSRDGHFLAISKLFSFLKQNLYTLLEDTPHGLSRQMNKMLLSFHDPENERNQILYCSLGSGDYELVEAFIKKYCTSTFPSKMFDYKGEEIRIYPLEDGDFLACYVTSDFLVTSYQKRLIEQVIDARLSGQSLLKEQSFCKMQAGKKKNVAAMIYARLHSLDMGKKTDGLHPKIAVGGWAEFDMTMNGNAIYFSGISNDADSCLTLTNVLRKQRALEGFPGVYLPSTTYLFSRRSVSDMQAMFEYSAQAEYVKATYSDNIRGCDEALLDYLKENCKQDIVSCLFQRPDTSSTPAAVVSIAVTDAVMADRSLGRLIDNAFIEQDKPKAKPLIHCCAGGRSYPLYLLPRNTLFVQLTGVTQPSLYTYACFYGDRLLLAPDVASLSSYVNYMEKGETMEEVNTYKEGIAGLSDVYNFMLVVNLADAMSYSESYARLIPSFFFRNPDLFRHFTFSLQFSCSEQVVYSNVVLTYNEGLLEQSVKLEKDELLIVKQ